MHQDHLAQVYAQFPINVVDGAGVYLRTADGRKILDLYGGHAVAALGYGHPKWVAALTAQAQALVFQSNAVALDVRERAAAKLAQFCGLGLDTVFFVNSGAEANENALKLALKATGRREVIAVEGSFHGRTAAAGAVTWGADKKWYGFPTKPFDVTFIPADDNAAGVAVTEKTAAIIVEPVQGVAGAVDMPKSFLETLRRRADETGAVLIFDEVQCGMGRVGHPFAANLYGVTPDIITTAKALGAGFPVSAVLLGQHMADTLKADALGTTFGGGPMACALVEAVIDIIESENLLANVRERAQEIRDTCLVGCITAAQGAGLLLGLRTTRPAKDVQAELLRHDILIGTSADPHVLRILAPYTLQSAHVRQLRDALTRIAA
jgi:acetylornithine/succinyldiaminopimelate/putrescine aminotransferase